MRHTPWKLRPEHNGLVMNFSCNWYTGMERSVWVFARQEPLGKGGSEMQQHYTDAVRSKSV